MKFALSGKQGSGKTTLAEPFINKYGFTHLSFAKAVKEVAMKEYNLSWEEAFGNKKDRVLLQRIGLEKRNIDKDYWVNKVIEEMKQDPTKNYIVDDVRYKNEYEALKKNGFVMIRLDARELLREARLGSKFANPTHISETDLDSIEIPNPNNSPDIETWDVFIANNSDVPTLIGFADSIYKAFDENTDLKDKV